MNSIILAIVLVSVAVIDAAPTPAPIKERVRACYFSNWSQHRDGAGKYLPEHYESGLCSHIFYAFVGMNDQFKLEPTEKNDLGDLTGNNTEVGNKTEVGLYARVNELKTKQTDLKTILAFGGSLFARDKTELMRKMLALKINRKKFIDDVIAVVRKHKFDGFSVEWYPALRDKFNFELLIKEMRDAMEKESTTSKLPRLILTIAVPPQIQRIKDGYNPLILAKSVDHFNLMAFDYHGSWEKQTGFNAPIDSKDGLSINETVRHLINGKIVRKEQLLLGLPAFGRGWMIASSEKPNIVPSPALGPSPAGPFTNASGHLAFFEICRMLENNSLVSEWNELARVPFAYDNRTVDINKNETKEIVWISYDDVKSIHAKLDLVDSMELAGVFVWTLDQDDFEGRCMASNGKYPLIKIVGDRLGKRLDGQREMTTIKFDGQKEMTTTKLYGEKEMTTIKSDVPNETTKLGVQTEMTTTKLYGQKEMTTIKSDVPKETTTKLDVQTTTNLNVPKETTIKSDVPKETTTKSDVQTTTKSDIPKETTTKLYDPKQMTTIKSDVPKETTTRLDAQTETTTKLGVQTETTTKLNVPKETTTIKLP